MAVYVLLRDSVVATFFIPRGQTLQLEFHMNVDFHQLLFGLIQCTF
jgi:hypothetical protein